MGTSLHSHVLLQRDAESWWPGQGFKAQVDGLPRSCREFEQRGQEQELACSGNLSQEQAELPIHTHGSPGQPGMGEGCWLTVGGVTRWGSCRLSLTLCLTVHWTVLRACLDANVTFRGQ